MQATLTLHGTFYTKRKLATVYLSIGCKKDAKPNYLTD